MTRKRKKTTIITETDRVLILNRRSGAVEGWCEAGSDFAGMVRPNEPMEWAAFRLGPGYPSRHLADLPSTNSDPAEGELDLWLRPA